MIYNFDNPFVFWTKVNNHEKIKQTILPIIRKLSENNTCTITVDGSTTTYYHQSYPYITHQMLDDIIWNPLNEMMNAKDLPQPRLGYNIEGLWWNNYALGGKTPVHKHERADWSGIYILHLEGENTTTFCSQYGQSPNSGYMNETRKFTEIGEGNVMIFPGFMQHYADVAEGNRIIISFDVIHDEPKIPLIISN